MKQIIWFILLFLPWLQPAPALCAGQELQVFYSNDVRGETEPCGCQLNQLGGLSRKGFQFNKIAAASAKRPHLTLDGGDLLFKEETSASGPSAEERMAAKAIVEAYALMGYQAVAVGGRDLNAGLDFLRALSKETPFAWLSANLVAKETKQPIFAASIRLQAGPVRATVIGLTGPTPRPLDAAATLLPWEQVLPGLLAEADNAADLVILLSNLPEADNRRLAETYNSIHLIIQSGASSTSGTISPAPVNNTLLVNTAPQGRQIGILEIDWQSGRQWGERRSERLAKQKAALDSLQWQLSKYRRDKDPVAALRDQPDRLQAYQLLLQREQGLQGEIAQLSQGGAPQGATEAEPASYRNRFLTMEDSLPVQPEIVTLIDRLDRAVNQLGRDKARAPVDKDSPYLGSQACAPCHAEQLAAWKKTKHAGAYETLVEKKQQYNTSCLPCHVTGVSMAERDEALSVADHRREVGCETCHGPGRLHQENPQANPLTTRPEPTLCRECHAPPHDTTFDYEQRLKLVH